MATDYNSNPTPREFLQALTDDIAAKKVSAFAVIIVYEPGVHDPPGEALAGVLDEREERMIKLIPLLEKVLAQANEIKQRVS